MRDNPLKQLLALWQSPWLDFLSLEVSPRLARDTEGTLSGLGVDLEAAAGHLLEEGTEKMTAPCEALLQALECARRRGLE